MRDMKPTEVLNDNMEFLVDYLKRELKCLGKMNGLSDSQISDMERDFIARLAFAAIIGDDEKEPEKEPEKESEKSNGLPSDVINALLYVKRICEDHECDDCPFGGSGGLFCKLFAIPKDWGV